MEQSSELLWRCWRFRWLCRFSERRWSRRSKSNKKAKRTPKQQRWSKGWKGTNKRNTKSKRDHQRRAKYHWKRITNRNNQSLSRESQRRGERRCFAEQHLSVLYCIGSCCYRSQWNKRRKRGRTRTTWDGSIIFFLKITCFVTKSVSFLRFWFRFILQNDSLSLVLAFTFI